MKFSKKTKGFTLIEMLIVCVIIAVLSAVALANFRSGQRRFALQRASSKLAQDIRRVQEKAMSGLKEDVCFEGGEPRFDDYKYSYGIYLKSVGGSEEEYVLFADCDGDELYNLGSDAVIEEISFEKGVEIKQMDENVLNIVFIPPDPSIFIGNEDSPEGGLDSASIIITLEREPSKTATITVNKAGLIDLD